MNAIPARVAGVERLVICCPTPDGVVNPLVLLAALKQRTNSHTDTESILRESGLPAVFSAGEFEGHIAHSMFVALELLQGRVVFDSAGCVLPLFL